MKKIIIALLILSNTAKAIETDKFAHFAGSYAISLTCYNYMRKQDLNPVSAYAVCVGITLAVTGFKEGALDSHFDWDDMKANALGAALPVVPIVVINF